MSWTAPFYTTCGQQQFEENAEISPIKIKIENEKIELMFQKYNKYIIRFKLESLIFSSSIKNNTEKIFLVINGLSNAKYSLINGKLFQTVGVINLNKIENWGKIKKSSRWLNVNFHLQTNNRSAKHFSYNFSTRKTGDVLNFTLKLIDNKNKIIKFEKNEKKFLVLGFLIEFIWNDPNK